MIIDEQNIGNSGGRQKADLRSRRLAREEPKFYFQNRQADDFLPVIIYFLALDGLAFLFRSRGVSGVIQAGSGSQPCALLDIPQIDLQSFSPPFLVVSHLFGQGGVWTISEVAWIIHNLEKEVKYWTAGKGKVAWVIRKNGI